MHSTTSTLSTCPLCDAPHEYDDGLCDQCRDYHTWCSVCDEYVSNDGSCRHVGFSEDLGNFCCEDADSTFTPEFRPALHKLLDAVPGLGDALLQELPENGIGLWYWGSLLGPINLDNHSDFYHSQVGDLLGKFFRALDLETCADIDDLVTAEGWLHMLWGKETPIANKLTLEWCSEWKTK